jgi:hypothetical protein
VINNTEIDNENEATEPPSKARRISFFTKTPRAERTAHRSVYWPRDLLPHTVPNARVLTYGYDTSITHRVVSLPSKITLYDIAGDFLVALEAERRPDASRPVLFVAHSLGGIVVKEMLRRSNGYHMSQAHLHGVFEATVGIVFFGTPHAGADPRGLVQHVAEMAAEVVGFSVNKQILNTLLPTSDRLREQRDEFNIIAHKKEWIIHSFQEQIGVGLLGGRKVYLYSWPLCRYYF